MSLFCLCDDIEMESRDIMFRMSWCASFGRDFWDGYRSLVPQDEGFETRQLLYNAYHQLNHYNLFGGGYLSSARSELNDVKSALVSSQ